MDTIQGKNGTFRLLEFTNLVGSDYLVDPTEIYYSKTVGKTLKQVQIELQNGSVSVEAGALHFMKGDISIENTMGGTKGMFKKLASSMLTNETLTKPKYTGSGEIFLEPSFQNFLFLNIEDDEVIVDKGMFYCCESTVDVGVAMQSNLSSAVAGGEGLFQTKLKGSGVVVLSSAVPLEAIVKVDLNNETLKVDGSFAVLRTSGIEFSVEKSTKGLIGSASSGEGLLQTFKGTGQVWLAPTTN